MTVAVATRSLRTATAADLDTMVDLGLRFNASGIYPRLAMTEQGLRNTIGWVLEHGRVWVALKDEQIVAGFGMTVLPHMLTGQLYAAEVFWWSNPEARGHGLKLFYAAEAWAKAEGVTMMQLVAPTPEAEQLYQRLGYAKVEAVYSKEFVC